MSTGQATNGCICRWNEEGDRVVTCERHQGWLEVIAEWADRAREAEKKLKESVDWKARALKAEKAVEELAYAGFRRKPLTEEEMEKIAAEYWLYPRKFVRAIEAKHGIKGDA